jgi:hypothetical protein
MALAPTKRACTAADSCTGKQHPTIPGPSSRIWTISLGSQAEQDGPRPDVTQLPESHIARQKLKRAVGQAPRRQLSCLVRGSLLLLAHLFLSKPWQSGAFCSEPWPEQRSPPLKRVGPDQQRVRAQVRERKQRSTQSAKKRKRAAKQAS